MLLQATHSVEDAENLVNTLLMLDTFFLGFIMSSVGGIGYEDLLAADVRFATAPDASEIKKFFDVPDDSILLISQLYAWRSTYSVAFLSSSMILGIGCIIGLNFSDCRENEESFVNWMKYFKYVIGLGYCLFIIAFIGIYAYFCAAQFIVFPKYCKTTRETSNIYAPKDAVFDIDTETMKQGCSVEAMKGFLGGDMVTALNILCPVLIILMVFASVYLTRTKTNNAPSDKVAPKEEHSSMNNDVSLHQ
jgi:hypothetical protein